MRCIRCHRPMKHATESGLGPVCGRAAKPIPAVERDLFGFDVAAAVQSARVRLALFIAWSVLDAKVAVRQAFAAARGRLGVA